MLERLKTALVDSYVGAIALGLLFSQGIERVGSIFADPVTRWLMMRQQQNGRLPYLNLPQPRFPFELAIPGLFTALFFLVTAFVLLRWLYFPAAEKPEQEPTDTTEQGA